MKGACPPKFFAKVTSKKAKQNIANENQGVFSRLAQVVASYCKFNCNGRDVCEAYVYCCIDRRDDHIKSKLPRSRRKIPAKVFYLSTF